MCFHDDRERLRYEAELTELRKKAETRQEWIHVRPIGDPRTKYSMPVPILNRQEMANTLRDLLLWHPATIPDLSEVNHARYQCDYDGIELLQLPYPNRDPHPGVEVDDMDGVQLKAVVEKYMVHA